MQLDASHRRWLLISRGAIVFVALGLIFVGGLLAATKGASGQSVNRSSIDIAASPDIVFEWITDSDLTPQWISGVESSQPLTSGGVEIGARFKQVVVSGDGWIELVSEITEVDAPSHLVMQIVAEQMTVVIQYDLEDTGTGTKLSYQSDAQYQPFMVRLLEPFVRVSVQKKLENDLATLKRLTEAE